jgi:hypothetical protein
MSGGMRVFKVACLCIAPLLLLLLFLAAPFSGSEPAARHFRSVADTGSVKAPSSLTATMVKAALGGCGASSTIPARIEDISDDEMQSLNDPFGRQVFRADSAELRLERILNLLKEDADQTHSSFRRPRMDQAIRDRPGSAQPPLCSGVRRFLGESGDDLVRI